MQQTDFIATVFDGKGNPNKVTVAFTMALNAILKGHTATIILMVEAVELGKPGAADEPAFRSHIRTRCRGSADGRKGITSNHLNSAV